MATPKDIIGKVAEELASAGIKVTFVEGWETRARPGDFTPRGLVCHHTAGPAAGEYPSLATVRDGRGGDDPLPGPLAQFGLGRSGQVFVIAAGKANHAGPGEFRGLSGNNSVWGIEAENTGLGQPWPDVQLDAYARLAAALARHTGFTSDLVAAHREWTPFKIDPAGIDMDDFRARIAQILEDNQPGQDRPGKNQPQQDTEDTSMFIFDGPNGGVFRTDGMTRWPIRSMQTASLFMDVARVRHLGTLTQEAFSDLVDGEATASILQGEIGQLRDKLASVEQKVDGVAGKVAALH